MHVNARKRTCVELLRTGKSWRSRGRPTPESRRLILRAEVPARCPRGPRAFAYFSISIYHPRVFLFILLAARAKRASVAAVPCRSPPPRAVLRPSFTRAARASARSLIARPPNLLLPALALRPLSRKRGASDEYMAARARRRSALRVYLDR